MLEIGLKVFVWFAKVFAVIVGVIIALNLSGDIKGDATFKITRGLIMRLTTAAVSSLFFGQSIIEMIDVNMSVASQGSIMLLTAVFSLLIIGLLYKGLELQHGKSASEIMRELMAVLRAIIGR